MAEEPASEDDPGRPPEQARKRIRKHTPGRGHRRKSERKKKIRFGKKATKKREDEKEAAKREWDRWDRLSEPARRLRDDLKPKRPRPTNDN
jgi:hypothetical protein